MKQICIYLIISSCLVTICACGFFKTYDNITRHGYDIKKDTLVVKPYEYFKHYKGYTPIYRQLTPTNKLDLKINIRGFENTDTIPIATIFKDFQIDLDNKYATIVDGELLFSRAAITHVLNLDRQRIDTCRCKLSFGYLKERDKMLRQNDLVFFWNVTVLKDGERYSIPARAYILK